MPDATGLELLAGELRDRDADAVLDTEFFRGQAIIHIRPDFNRTALEVLAGEHGFTFLSSVHGVDYFPEEPRLGVQYVLRDMPKVDMVQVKLRVPLDTPVVQSVVDLFPTANYQEREVYDMFGVEFEGHPDLTRIHMPEDYEGFPQRRDFPIGGEPVLFTHNEPKLPDWWR